MARDWRTMLLRPETHVSYLIAVMDVSCWYGTQSGFPMGNGIVANDKACVHSLAFVLRLFIPFIFLIDWGEVDVKK